jgi:hypothetical protein
MAEPLQCQTTHYNVESPSDATVASGPLGLSHVPRNTRPTRRRRYNEFYANTKPLRGFPGRILLLRPSSDSSGKRASDPAETWDR